MNKCMALNGDDIFHSYGHKYFYTYKERQVLQSATDCYYKVCQVLQSVTGCYYKVHQVLQSATVITK